jgi:hypothetical protein
LNVEEDVGVPIAIRSHLVPFPTGKIKAVVPVFVMGPSTKLDAEVPDVDEPVAMFRILEEVVFIFPAVSVNMPFTVIAFPRVMAEDEGEVVLLMVRLLKVEEEVPPIVCAAVPEKRTVLPVLV